jgi:5-methylcytosine-specific restriction enzyme subunit McrC
MKRFVLDEYRTEVFSTEDAVFAKALAATGLVTATLDLDGRLRLTATSTVGVVQVSAHRQTAELRVRPKLPIGRLFWLLGHARNDRGWRPEPAELSTVQDLLPAMAVAFSTAVSRALAPGVLQGYRIAEEASYTLRGRLREADQLRRRLGLAVPLEVRYDDYSVDIPENQILRAAADQLRAVPGIPATARQGLHRIGQTLANVTRLIAGAPLPPTTDTRLTARYRPALRLARLVLARHGTEHHAGGLRAAGFAFNLNQVFEDWLTAVLSQAFTDGTVVAQHPMTLDAAGTVGMKPDITWWRNGTCRAVIDAKYKRSTANADLYQMLAYCTTLGLPQGHLVYANDHAPRCEHQLTGAGVRVVAHGLDLAAPLEDLRAQIRHIADEISQEHLQPS